MRLQSTRDIRAFANASLRRKNVSGIHNYVVDVMKHKIGVTAQTHVPRFFLGSPDRQDRLMCVELPLTDEFLGALAAIADQHRSQAGEFFREKTIAARWHLHDAPRMPPLRTLLAGDPYGGCLIQWRALPAPNGCARRHIGGEAGPMLYFHGGEEFLLEVEQAKSQSCDIVESGCHTLFDGGLAHQEVSVEEYMLLRRSNCPDADRFFPGTFFASFEEWVKFKQLVFALRVNAALLRTGRPPLRTEIFDAFPGN